MKNQLFLQLQKKQTILNYMINIHVFITTHLFLNKMTSSCDAVAIASHSKQCYASVISLVLPHNPGPVLMLISTLG